MLKKRRKKVSVDLGGSFFDAAHGGLRWFGLRFL